MRWLSSSLGKKYVMALTGFFLVFFALAHMLGNLTTFGGPAGLNAYAEHLRAFPPVLWAFRALMAGAVVLHLFFGLTLYLQNKAARPVDYACKKNDRTTFSAQSMVWTGLLLLVFVVIHLVQFTFHGLLPSGAIIANTAEGHFNVFAAAHPPRHSQLPAEPRRHQREYLRRHYQQRQVCRLRDRFGLCPGSAERSFRHRKINLPSKRRETRDTRWQMSNWTLSRKMGQASPGYETRQSGE